MSLMSPEPEEHVVDDDDARIRLLTEIWRDIPNYEGRYEISSLGCVRSLPIRAGNNRIYGGKVKKLTMDSNGYPEVGLSVGGVCNRVRVHVLVASAFHGPMPAWAQCVRHLDGNQTYNTPWNCIWGTDAENMQDMVRHGRSYWANKETCKEGHALVQMGRQRRCPVCKPIQDHNSYLKRKEAANA